MQYFYRHAPLRVVYNRPNGAYRDLRPGGFFLLKIHQIYLKVVLVHANCGRGSVFLRRQCYTLCTSGFVDDVMFAHNRQAKATPVGRVLKSDL